MLDSSDCCYVLQDLSTLRKCFLAKWSIFCLLCLFSSSRYSSHWRQHFLPGGAKASHTSVTYSLLQPKGCRGKGKYKGRLNIYAWARKVWKVDWGGRWAGEREDWPHADSAHPCKLWSGLKESTAVFTLISTAVWWSTGATWGYRMSPVYSATWAQTAESQDVSLRGTIDPTVSVGGKPGRSNHIRPTLTCHMSRVFLNNSLFFTY